MRGIRKSPSQIRKGHGSKQGDIQPEQLEKARKKIIAKKVAIEKMMAKEKPNPGKAKPVKSSLLAFMAEKKASKQNAIDVSPIKKSPIKKKQS
jgi:hypothetical protein